MKDHLLTSTEQVVIFYFGCHILFTITVLFSTEQEKNIAESILGYKFERLLGYCRGWFKTEINSLS